MASSDTREQQLLRKHYVTLVDHVDTVMILDSLFQDHVIEIDDYERVRSGLTPRDRVRCLLSILWRKMAENEKRFYDFIKVLKEDYGYLDLIKEAVILKTHTDDSVADLSGAADGPLKDKNEGVGLNPDSVVEATDCAETVNLDMIAASSPEDEENSVVALPAENVQVPPSFEKISNVDQKRLPADIGKALLNVSLTPESVKSLYANIQDLTSDSGTILHENRQLEYRLKGNFYRWKWVWQGSVTDVTSGVTGRSENKSGRRSALEGAINDLVAKLNSN